MSRLPEQKAWDNFSGTVPLTKLKLFRVENMCVDGMSDVLGINRKGTVFWIENKAIPEWPPRPTTCPLKDAFEPGQIPFMRQWKWWGGNAFVLLRVNVEFVLLDPDADLRSMNAMELLTGAISKGKRSIYEHLESL